MQLVKGMALYYHNELLSSMHIKYFTFPCFPLKLRKLSFKSSIEQSGHKTKLSNQDELLMRNVTVVTAQKPWSTSSTAVNTTQPRFGNSLADLSPWLSLTIRESIFQQWS
jgi:hypothetical protein